MLHLRPVNVGFSGLFRSTRAMEVGKLRANSEARLEMPRRFPSAMSTESASLHQIAFNDKVLIIPNRLEHM